MGEWYQIFRIIKELGIMTVKSHEDSTNMNLDLKQFYGFRNFTWGNLDTACLKNWYKRMISKM